MHQADSTTTTIVCKPGCACPDCLATQEAEAERRGPEREPVFDDLILLRRELRDCFEGCVPFREAIEMVGAPDHHRKMLAADWRRWNRMAEG